MAATVKKEEEKTREEQTQEEKLSGIDSIMGKNQYTPGDTVQQAQQRLNAKREDKPGQYSSRWQEQMDGILRSILNRKEFRYDVNADPLFQQYRDQYTRAGQTAMQDTMGKAAQLTGGYGNSYAQQAGQQTYNTYMQGLTDKIPELYSLALQAYNNQGNDLKDRYSLLGTADNQDYGRYRDSVSDYNTELDRLTNEYNTERSYDYGQYRDNMTDAQQRWTNAWTLYQKGYKTPEILEILGLPEDGGKTGGGGGGHSSGSGRKGTGPVDLATEAAKIASKYGGSAAYKYINDQLGGKTTSAEANKAKQAAINAAAKANKRY